MLQQRLNELVQWHNRSLQLAIACGIGVLFGVASLRFSPLLVLGALAAILFMYATLKRPEIALLGILVATSSIVFEDQLPLLSAGGASLHIPDILLLGSLGLIVLRALVEPKFKLVHTPLDWPLLLFYGVTLLATFVAIFHASVGVVEARRMIRVMSYYLTFFVVTNLVRERRQLTLLLNGLFLLATVVAAAMVLQFLLGSSVHLLPGFVNSLATQDTIYGDITRIVPPGWSIILVSFVAIVCILVLGKFHALSWPSFLGCGLMGMATLLTFFRSYWAALIVVFLLLVVILKGRNRQRFIGWSLAVIIFAAMILPVVVSDPGSRAAKLVDASMDRLSTLGESGTFQGQDGSLNWRMLENGYALPSIAAHPWLGLGMGAQYRPYDRRLDVPGSNYDFRKLVHNGYLTILLGTGLLGYLAFMWLSLAFLVRGFRHWRSVTNYQLRGIVLGFNLAYLAVLIAAVVNSTFAQWRWTPVIGIILGINEVILRDIGGKSN